jgi:hypothetical protein
LPRFSLFTLFGVVTLIAAVLGAWQGLVMWNKSDFCRGWAEQYAAKAEQCEAEAKNPKLNEGDRAAYRLQAKYWTIIARKYAAVAERPWLPYPRAPLLTDADRQQAQATP